MNIITWIFFIIGKVLTVPMGSINEMKQAEEDGHNAYKKIKETTIGKKVLEQWWFKVLLLIVGIIWLIPYLRERMRLKNREPLHPDQSENVEYEIVE